MSESEAPKETRELTGEEALLAAGSVLWDRIPKNHREKIYKSLPADQIPEIAKAIRTGRKLRREGGAKK